jgi:outer membrane protein assembly factor BamB
MAFEIIEIVERQSDGIRAILHHGTHQILAVIAGSRGENVVVGESFQATIGYDEIRTWKVVDDFEDAKSGIWQEQDGIHLLGRVHNVLDYGDGKVIVEVYIQNGSELFAVDPETMDDVPEANDGLEITVGNLYLYPSK